jgi:membrane protein DedA with SNARE-associated domain
VDSLLQLPRIAWPWLPEGLVTWLPTGLQQGAWPYILLALFVAVEGPIATLAGAAAAGAGALELAPVFAAAFLGNLVADSLWYALGRSGRIEFAIRHGKWIGLKRQQVVQLESSIREHASKVLFAAKLTAGLAIPALMAAGMLRLAWNRWFPPVFIGGLIWNTALILLGYHATALLTQIARDVNYLAVGGSLLLVIYLYFKIRR